MGNVFDGVLCIGSEVTDLNIEYSITKGCQIYKPIPGGAVINQDRRYHEDVGRKVVR